MFTPTHTRLTLGSDAERKKAPRRGRFTVLTRAGAASIMESASRAVGLNTRSLGWKPEPVPAGTRLRNRLHALLGRR